MTIRTETIHIGSPAVSTPVGVITRADSASLGRGVAFRDIGTSTGCLIYTDIAMYGFASGSNYGERSGIGMDPDFSQVEIRSNNTLVTCFTADGTNFQTRRIDNFRINTTNHTSDATIVDQDTGSVQTNLGASTTITLTLPSNPSEGQNYTIYRVDNQILRVQPAPAEGSSIIVATGKRPNDYYVELGSVGSCVKLVCNTAGDWMAVYENGIITVEV